MKKLLTLILAVLPLSLSFAQVKSVNTGTGDNTIIGRPSFWPDNAALIRSAISGTGASPGIMVVTSPTTSITRVLTSSSSGLVIANGSGTGGNPTFTLDADLQDLADISWSGTDKFLRGDKTLQTLNIAAMTGLQSALDSKAGTFVGVVSGSASAGAANLVFSDTAANAMIVNVVTSFVVENAGEGTINGTYEMVYEEPGDDIVPGTPIYYNGSVYCAKSIDVGEKWAFKGDLTSIGNDFYVQVSAGDWPWSNAYSNGSLGTLPVPDVEQGKKTVQQFMDSVRSEYISSKGGKIMATDQGGLKMLPSYLGDGSPAITSGISSPDEFAHIAVYSPQDSLGTRRRLWLANRADLSLLGSYREGLSDGDPGFFENLWLQGTPIRIGYSGAGSACGVIEFWGEFDFYPDDMTPPANTTTPAAWMTIKIEGGDEYKLPLYQ